MCGICGVFNPEQLSPKDAQEICMRMGRAMPYRGPDEEGFYGDDRIALGHRRLSIIDLNSGQQPMKDDRYVIVFNGEIYNFRELRSELASDGYRFKTKSDTEVIIAGYEKWENQVLDRLRGMFAFVVYDIKRGRIFAARDPVGKKPLYYHLASEGTFYFASDLQSLAASGVLSGKISLEAMQCYFTLGYIPSPMAVYSDVYKLQAGHALQYSQSGLKTWPYWDIDLSIQEDKSEEALAGELEDLLNKAVKRRLIADVPLGALLSGGIDSNVVVATMAKQSPTPVRTYTIGFAEKAEITGTRDERKAAAEAAQYYGTIHDEISVNDASGTMLPQVISYLGEPLADSSIIPTYLVCHAARKHLKVALTGDGGDEPFGGYSFRYLPHLMEERIRAFIPAPILAPFAAALAFFWPSSDALPRYLRLHTIFRNLAVSSEEAFCMDQAIRKMKDNPLKPDIINGQEAAFQLINDLYSHASGRDELTRMLYVDVKLYMAENVLAKADRMSMANSLELRSPLLDRDVVSFAFSLPGQMKVKGSNCKYLLKKVAANRIDPRILHLPKTGFSIPIDRYFRTKWKLGFEERVFRGAGELHDYINLERMTKIWQEFQGGSNSPLQLLWAAYILAHWFSEFHRRQSFAT